MNEQRARQAVGTRPEPAGSEPSHEHGNVCGNRKCGRPLDAESLAAGRCRHCRCVLAGNQLARKHGRFAAVPPPLLPAEGDSPADTTRTAPSASAQLREDLTADQSGEMTTAKRLMITRVVELEAIGRAIASSLVANGVLTERGRPRSAVGAYLSVVSSQERILARLGLEPRKKDVLDVSLEHYLRQGGNADAQEPEAQTSAGQTEETSQQTEKTQRHGRS